MQPRCAACGSCATEICESCQVRNEAALSRTFRVPQGCLYETQPGLFMPSDVAASVKIKYNETVGALEKLLFGGWL